MATRTRILVMPAGRQQVPAILEAQRMGLEVLAIDRDPNAEALPYADLAEVVDPADVEQAAGVAKDHAVAAVVPVANDVCVVTAAVIAERLHLNALPVAVAQSCRNKRLARSKLRERGPQYCPAWCMLSSLADLPGVSRELGYPVVLKPTDNSGSRGVTIVCADECLVQGYKHALEFSEEGLVLAEELLRGGQVSIETLTHAGTTEIVGISDTLITEPPYCAITGHTMPSRLPEQDLAVLKSAARDIVNIFEIERGPAHVEMFMTKEGPKLIDIAARLSGGHIASHLVPLATGVNITRATISIALGQDPDIRCGRQRGAAIRFLNLPAGRIESIEGMDKALQSPGVVEAVCTLKPEDHVSRCENSSSRVGHVIAYGDNAKEAAQNAERALSSLKILVETLPEAPASARGCDTYDSSERARRGN